MNYEVELVEDIRSATQARIGYRRIKRILDILVSITILTLLSPLLLFLAVGIKVHSPGPVIYRQKRVGKNGKVFEMLKFRSMRDGNDPNVHKQHVQSLIQNNIDPQQLGQQSLKMAVDPRITGLGRFMRKLGLDELPQFFNVLKGEMSIVGPRPPLPYEVEVYTNWHKQRLAALPGITGIWQVMAHNKVSFEEMVHMDLDYIRQMSLGLDLKIMALTPIEMLKAKE